MEMATEEKRYQAERQPSLRADALRAAAQGSVRHLKTE